MKYAEFAEYANKYAEYANNMQDTLRNMLNTQAIRRIRNTSKILKQHAKKTQNIHTQPLIVLQNIYANDMQNTRTQRNMQKTQRNINMQN